MSRLEVRVHRNIAEVDPREWDSILDADDLQATHRFARVCSDSRIQDAELRHLLVRRGGRLEATASLTRLTVSLDLLSPGSPRQIAGIVRRVHPDFLRVPVIFCGLPVSFGTSSLRFAPESDIPAASSGVARAMEEFAEESRVGLLCFKEFTSEEHARLASLRALGYYTARSLPGCALRVAWTGLDGYLAAMREGYRRQARSDLAALRRAPLDLETKAEFGADCREIYALYSQVMDRARFQLERLPLAFFQRLAAEMGSAAQALLLRHGQRLAAAAVLLRGQRTLTFLLAGLDYSGSREHHAYQNLVLAVIAEGIRGGMSRIELGQTSYALKTRLGAFTEARWILLRHRGTWRHRLLRSSAPMLFPETRVPRRRVFSNPATTSADAVAR